MTSPETRQSYDDHLSKLKERLTEGEAFKAAIGGQFSAMGLLEYYLLVSLGLKENHSVIDIGCGSGRLACRLASLPSLSYLGTDVVADLLMHACQLAQRPDWRFLPARGTTIPSDRATADFVCFFSVFTHLSHEDTYRYLKEAKRVLRPGGKIVFSFLEFRIPCHWEIFEHSLNHTGAELHLNQFMDRDGILLWAAKLGLTAELIADGGKPHIPIPETIVLENGHTMERLGNLGQSVAVLSVPRERFSGGNPAPSGKFPGPREISLSSPAAGKNRAASDAPPVVLRPGVFVNLAVRGQVGNIAEPLILGFVIQEGEKQLLVRAVGAGLAGFGVNNCLTGAQITVVAQDGTTVGANAGLGRTTTDEKNQITRAAKNVAAFAIGENDAALIVRVKAGAYSIVVNSADGGSGQVLAEIYDLKSIPL